jgi:coproporphyrinogen III oxidase
MTAFAAAPPLSARTAAASPSSTPFVARRGDRGAALTGSGPAAAPRHRRASVVRAISWDDHKAVAAPAESLVRAAEVGTDTMRTRFEAMIRAVQNEICGEIEALDGAKFHEDAWVRDGGGGGISRVIQNGNIFEKAGVNVSVVYGTMPPEAVASASARGVTRDVGYQPGEPVPFFAAGISSVMHPRNPMAPTMHFNYRYFETDRGLWWFGGGTDLTPALVYEDDVRHFHGVLKEACDRHDAAYYPRFKKWADEYFVNKHRGETRGVGGIFFDDLNEVRPGRRFAASAVRGMQGG